MEDALVIAGHTFRSRLFLGTGKYRSHEEATRCLEASGAEMITVAVRRVKLDRTDPDSVLHYIDPKRYQLLQIGRAHV